MADDGSKQSANVWSLQKFYFKVEWDKNEMYFQEVSGLDIQSEEIKYRHGDNPAFSPIKMPSMKKIGSITMKKGVFKDDNKFWDWFNRIKINTIKRAPMKISLLDEVGRATMVWTLTNAFPNKISGTELKSEGNEATIEAMEIAHEGLTITNA
jgi:phage tail-like protein